MPNSIAAAARHTLGEPTFTSLNAITIDMSHAIADTGATSIFIMEGTPVNNKRVATKPLTINLPDGTKVMSTHICDITIPGLPTILIGHIVPKLTIASLIGIRELCKAGCTVTFSTKFCDVFYNERLILRGHKDPSTDLWTLPLTTQLHATPHKLPPPLAVGHKIPSIVIIIIIPSPKLIVSLVSASSSASATGECSLRDCDLLDRGWGTNIQRRDMTHHRGLVGV